ncbi:uncharacterized protein LOC110278063 [Arachis duranensis]|uniref:Uncharacterized protein LOC110278063 n=1 Tax=Arachis duranensis TaxID=130453 RepID=A0A6P5N2S6_ARADU|nr:uncharacterized protein LOC110278063 [Arachis duranensis]
MEEGARAGIDSEGGKAITDPPGLVMESGFGGLGLEGIVGNEDSEGVKAALPGVGNKGSISGESVGDTIGEEEEEEEGESTLGNTVGAAEIVETCMVLCEANNVKLHDAINKAMKKIKNEQREAINDVESIAL